MCNTGENDRPQYDTTESVDNCDENIKLCVTPHVQQSVDPFDVSISFVF